MNQSKTAARARAERARKILSGKSEAKLAERERERFHASAVGLVGARSRAFRQLHLSSADVQAELHNAIGDLYKGIEAGTIESVTLEIIACHCIELLREGLIVRYHRHLERLEQQHGRDVPEAETDRGTEAAQAGTAEAGAGQADDGAGAWAEEAQGAPAPE